MNKKVVFKSKKFDEKMKGRMDEKHPSSTKMLDQIMTCTYADEVTATCEQLAELLTNFEAAVTGLLKMKRGYDLVKNNLALQKGITKRHLL